MDCVFDHIQVGEGARYFTQCLVNETLCRSEMDEHLDESWDCMQACSQQSLADDNATLRPEVSCWVSCMQKAIEDLDANGIVQDVFNRPICLSNSAIAAIVVAMALGFCTLTVLMIWHCVRSKAEQLDLAGDGYVGMDEKGRERAAVDRRKRHCAAELCTGQLHVRDVEGGDLPAGVADCAAHGCVAVREVVPDGLLLICAPSDAAGSLAGDDHAVVCQWVESRRESAQIFH